MDGEIINRNGLLTLEQKKYFLKNFREFPELKGLLRGVREHIGYQVTS